MPVVVRYAAHPPSQFFAQSLIRRNGDAVSTDILVWGEVRKYVESF